MLIERSGEAWSGKKVRVVLQLHVGCVEARRDFEILEHGV
jgi:hypothetical protein